MASADLPSVIKASARAGQLVAGGTRKNRDTEEGVFYMPFQINFEALGCSSEQ